METADASVVARERVRELVDVPLTREDRAILFRYMTMMRASEERALTLYKQGKVPGSFYDGRGQEAVSVGAAFVLRPEDRMCILHRDLGAHFVRGVTPDRYLAGYMGRSGGVTTSLGAIPAPTSDWSAGTANSGVPMNTMRGPAGASSSFASSPSVASTSPPT